MTQWFAMGLVLAFSIASTRKAPSLECLTAHLPGCSIGGKGILGALCLQGAKLGVADSAACVGCVFDSPIRLIDTALNGVLIVIR